TNGSSPARSSLHYEQLSGFDVLICIIRSFRIVVSRSDYATDARRPEVSLWPIVRCAFFRSRSKIVRRIPSAFTIEKVLRGVRGVDVGWSPIGRDRRGRGRVVRGVGEEGWHSSSPSHGKRDDIGRRLSQCEKGMT
ncbi:hypothetical protein V1478_013563, partial [Vespula squamosa]